MSFLNKRRSVVPNQLRTNASIPHISSPLPPAVENLYSSPPSVSSTNVNKSSGPSQLIRRVSNLFSNRKKRPPKLPLAGTPVNTKWQATADCQSEVGSEDSEDDIRRPSGLGRAVSISSNRSLPPSPFTAINEESPFHVPSNTGYERSRAMSTPILRSISIRSKIKPSNSGKNGSLSSQSTARQVPPEVLAVVLSFLPSRTVASLARVSRHFLSASRIILYRIIDLRTIHGTQVENLITLLAFRHDLAEMVRTFECHTWPPFFIPSSNVPAIHSSSISSQLTATFTIAFQNMQSLTSLVLPSFDYTFLRHHSAFGLKSLVFHNHSISPAETTQLFTWLDGQINITHLAFPDLVELSDTPDTRDESWHVTNTPMDSLCTNNVLSPPLSVTPLYSPNSLNFPSSPPKTPTSPFNSPTLLPALSTLLATPSIFTSLLSSGHTTKPRPLKNVTLTINTTLYGGLRPSALMNSLQGITKLVLRFGPPIDKRTIGKVLSAAGAALMGNGSTDAEATILNDLQIELMDSTTGAAQTLYKVLASVLPRFQGLHILELHIHQPSAHDIPSSRSSSMTSTLSEDDRNQANILSKHCPSLQSITLLSGGMWRRTE